MEKRHLFSSLDPLKFGGQPYHSLGTCPPGWEGLKAKPVQVRRCPATVSRKRGKPGRPPS